MACPLEFLPEVDSTNSELLRRAASLPARYALQADRQSAGRGRHGRPWYSPPGGNLYLSLFARLRRPLGALDGLSLALGVALAECLRQHGVAAQVKWPNDLQVDRGKLGGLLIEVAGGAGEGCALVIGLGLNLDLGPEPPLDQPFTDLARLGIAGDRRLWGERCLDALLSALTVFEAEGLTAFAERWPALDALAGRQVEIDGGAGGAGEVLGIDARGALRLRTSAGEWRCQAGDVRVRAR